MKKYFKIIALLWITSIHLYAQNPLRFEQEIATLTANDNAVNKHKLILFAGSSSIRLWKTLETDLHDYNVLNRGFGGSEMTDLIYYFDKLILPYQAKQIFIYEGDNDLTSGKSPQQILSAADSLLTLIRTKVSKKVKVVFITPKPSLSRWRLKESYVAYNEGLKKWAKKKKNVDVADVWVPLVDEHGVVLQDIFIEDGLHLNAKGYALWTKAIRKYIR